MKLSGGVQRRSPSTAVGRKATYGNGLRRDCGGYSPTATIAAGATAIKERMDIAMTTKRGKMRDDGERRVGLSKCSLSMYPNECIAVGIRSSMVFD